MTFLWKPGVKWLKLITRLMLELSVFSHFCFIILSIAVKILLILSVIVVLWDKLFTTIFTVSTLTLFDKLRSIDESILIKNDFKIMKVLRFGDHSFNNVKILLY